jgi:SpoVK/Ycf46/Vps4 family AAA+-type ATPase
MQSGGLNPVLRVSLLTRWLSVCFFLCFLSVPCLLPAQSGAANNSASQAERDAQTQLQLTTDAQRVATYKAALTLMPERARRGEISQQQLPADLQYAQAAVTGAQQKYDALGGDWGRRFSQALDEDAQKLINDAHVNTRLADQQSPVGIDAHVATLLTLAIDQNAVLREQGAITKQQEEQSDGPVQSRLNALNAKYARSSEAADYHDRVTQLVKQGEAQQKEQWVLQAQRILVQKEAASKANPLSFISNFFSSLFGHSGPVISTSQTHSTSPVSIALLVLLLIGGAVYYFLQQSTQKPATAAYSDLTALSVASPATDSPEAQAAAAVPPAPPPAPKAPAAPLPPGAQKQRLFAEEREKYQASYNNMVDQVTAATAELGRLAKVVSGIQDNLKLLSKSIESRARALAVSHESSFANLARSAAQCKPVLRLYKRAGGLLKIVMLLGAGWLVLVLATLVFQQDWVDLALTLAGIFAVFFFVERYLQLKAPTAIFKRSGDKLKQLSLAYVYDDQVAMAQTGAPGVRVMRVLAESKGSPIEEFLLSANSWGTTIRPESSLLYVESMAVYRVESNGAFAPLFANNASELIQNYGRWINEALNEQKSFAAANLAPLATYAHVALRRRRASEQLPGLEKLVQRADRLESIWRDVAVSDKVMDLLLKRIDSFNMRHAATPAGILLYGSEGNGKTFLAKKIAESIEARFVSLDAATLTSADEVKNIWQSSRGKGPVVLFVDAAERVFPAAGSQQQGVGTQTSAAWVTEWNKFDASASRVWVIMSAANDSDKDIDRQILSRFGGSKIEIGSPDDAGRELILRRACRNNQLPSTLPSWLVDESRGLSVRNLLQIVSEASIQSMPNAPDDTVWRNALGVLRPWDPNTTWDKLILPEPILQKIKAACRIVREAEAYKAKGAEPPNILLWGPPGTGKTQVARTLANEARVPCIAAGTADLKGTHLGDSAAMVRQKFQDARGVAPSILFIDEIETSAADRKGPKSDQYTSEIVTQMLNEMDGITKNDNKPVFVLAATNIKESIDEAILSRFQYLIEIPPPDEKARKQMLKIEIGKAKAIDPALDVDEVAGVLAQKTARKAGRFLKMLVKRAIQHAVERSQSADDVLLTREDLLFEFPPEKQEDVQKIWDALVLPPNIKEQLWTARRLIREAEAYKAKGIEIPNILLYGPPGTGKTEIARTLAKLGGVGFVTGTTADMKGTHIGDSAKMVKDKFQEARDSAPAVLFIDEIEALAVSRTSAKADVYTHEIVNEMLQQMNGVQEFTSPVVILAATNLPEEIDEAIRKRFSNQIPIPLPDENARRQILKNQISAPNRPLAPGLDVEQVAAEMARRTEGSAGRELKMLVDRALQRAVSASKSADDLYMTADNLLEEVMPKDMSIPEDELQKIWSDIVLTPKLKNELMSRVRFFNKGQTKAPRGLLLYGPPGTGKSAIARIIERSCRSVNFMDLKTADLKGSHIGESAQLVKSAWESAKGHARTIMFIDECDAVFGKRTSFDSDSFVKEIVNSFIPYWDGKNQSGEVWIIGATNHKEVLDDAVMSRFGTPIEITPPDAAGRLEILRLEMKANDRDVVVPAFVGEATTGKSGRDLKLLAQKVRELAGDPQNQITPDLWRAALDGSKRPGPKTNATWEDLVLSDDLIRKFKTACRAIRQVEAIRKQGMAPPKAILLHGKPGTGKTQIARTLAHESGVNFKSVGPSELKAGWVGRSAGMVHDVFEDARSMAPCILFIDEIDAAFPKRGGPQTDQFTTEVVNQALTEINGINDDDRFIFLLGATNRLDMIDDGILSRFPETIEIPYPDAAQRAKILQVLIGKKPVNFDVGTVSAELAAITDNFSGRDLFSLVENASQAALARALDTDEAKADQLHIVISREDFLSQIPSSPARADAGLPAGA